MAEESSISRAQVANRLAEGPLAGRAADAASKRNSEPEW